MPSIENRRIYNLLVILITIVLTVIACSVIPKMRFNYDFEAFFPNEDSELELYNHYRETFDHDNEFILIAAENKQGIFRQTFLQKLDSLTTGLATLPYVRQATSATNLKTIEFDGLLPISRPVLHYDEPGLYHQDSVRIYNSAHLVGSFFPRDAGSLCVFVKTEPGLSKKKSDQLNELVTQMVAKYHFDETHVVGRIFAQKVYVDLLQNEFILFICIALIIVTFFLWFSFRSLYGIILPITIIMVSIIFTLAIMYAFGKEIDLMITILPTMIFIAGMSDVVHFFSKYFAELQKGTPKRQIEKLIFKEVGFPTFITLLTTVVGFLSLLFSNIQPIRDFGIFTSVGISIAFVLTYTLLPALLYFLSPASVKAANRNNLQVYGWMRKAMLWVFGHQRTILLVTALLIIISFVGISRIRINNILLDDLNNKVKIKQDFNFFDRSYSGARPLEILVKINSTEKIVWDYEVLQQLEKVEDFIKTTYSPGFLLSPVSVVKSINHSQTGSWELPDREDYTDLRVKIERERKNLQLQRVVTLNGKETRISGKIADIGSEKAHELNLKLLGFIEKNTDTKLLSFSITGAGHLIDRNNDYMVSNMLQGFGFSILVIGLLTFILHQSWRMVLVFIIPNVIPLFLIAGIMGYFGIELKAATSLIFSIAFGIATDDTIHFISRLRMERATGKTMLYAFKRTYFETGKPILFTTFILVGGFMSLMTSSFQSTFYFGFLICITVIIALLCDLFLLPVLLFWLYPSKNVKIPPKKAPLPVN